MVLYVPHKTPHQMMYFQGRVPTLQIIDVKPDSLEPQVLYVQVPNFTGSVQADKLHVHKLYSSLKYFYTLSYQAATYNQLLFSIMVYAILPYLTMQPVR
jgi:hypothetical protein